MLAVARAVVQRDLLLALRRRSDVATALLFFVIVWGLFPLAGGAPLHTHPAALDRPGRDLGGGAALLDALARAAVRRRPRRRHARADAARRSARSEERRVGKECR